ncbi:hypothetical protein EAX61_08285 [Dokdonia sinensis]|uniref:Plasmid pRiA4b Orf3-like domain-containing protein n=1 Tax=Dokdonia sinensis TaxID=2479847 RepID=A0A3M0GAR3_9FLAO|nr:hypothetical protein [Dokdonia sinensis]RMB59572.1 hypothetical protein EAX61_08285 [Dokdonia sinensis]
MIYRFRIILDTEEDVFRDLEIEETATLEDLSNAIIQSFGFDGMEVASFYMSNEKWEQGVEFPQFDTSEGDEIVRTMSETLLEHVVHENHTRLIYVYDFLNMWQFMVELAEIVEKNEAQTYPNLMFVQGQVPAHAPDIAFEVELDDDAEDEFDNDYDVDDFQDLNFDENWN